MTAMQVQVECRRSGGSLALMIISHCFCSRGWLRRLGQLQNVAASAASSVGGAASSVGGMANMLPTSIHFGRSITWPAVLPPPLPLLHSTPKPLFFPFSYLAGRHSRRVPTRAAEVGEQQLFLVKGAVMEKESLGKGQGGRRGHT